ncbi:unnamed protein product [Onchocerca flexuosa]|uniref:Sec7_N domain-containing protein n=1 Tax=Onchocerca flexuosa TaxID=387005 RepID=A0A183H123_9BILA|nr:unnamed protein product [Onchocerca flexuosa]
MCVFVCVYVHCADDAVYRLTSILSPYLLRLDQLLTRSSRSLSQANIAIVETLGMFLDTIMNKLIYCGVDENAVHSLCRIFVILENGILDRVE